jgi:hypothetical protein
MTVSLLECVVVIVFLDVMTVRMNMGSRPIIFLDRKKSTYE